ncbi:MAG TPA: SIS domain-containing protein [Caulobacteraceae bacterium]|jgi:D-sedoheptulose 7-phosphate isomerase
MTTTTDMKADIVRYAQGLSAAMALPAMDVAPILAAAMRDCWRTGGKIYLCGNGGSAGNANHLANDFLYGAGMSHGVGLRVESLSANAAVLTCLANDIGYENVYAEQLRVKADPGDVLVVLSGSGNSPNVVKALEMGAAKGMTTFAILGFSGGKCKGLAQHPIHFPVDDMQIAEDLQMIIGHVCMKWLVANPLAGATAPAAAE